MKCNNCGDENSDNAIFCGNCGTKIDNADKKKYCGNCGAVIEVEAVFCGECGAAVNNESNLSDNGCSHETSHKKRVPLVTIIIVLLITICLGTVVGVYMLKRVDDSQQQTVTEQTKDEVDTNREESKMVTPEIEKNTDVYVADKNGSDMQKHREETGQFLSPNFVKAEASSVRNSQKDSAGKLNDYSPQNVLDHDQTTCWAMDLSTGITPEITIRADEKQHVSGIKFADGYFKSEEIYMKNRRITEVKILYEGGYYEYSCGTSGQFLLMQDVQFAESVDTSYITIQVLNSVSGIYNDICISEIEAY